MPWVLWDIVFPLVITFLIGLLTGWLLWRWRRHKDTSKRVAGDSTAGNTQASNAAAVLIEERDAAQVRAEIAEAKLESVSADEFALPASSDRAALEKSQAEEKKAKAELEQALKLHQKEKNELAQLVAKKDAELADFKRTNPVSEKIAQETIGDSRSNQVTSARGPGTVHHLPGSTAAVVGSTTQVENGGRVVTTRVLSSGGSGELAQSLDDTLPVEQVQPVVAKKPVVKQKTATGYSPQGWDVPDKAPGKAERDDLQEIKGVGPVLERLLHKTGIYYFKQVALLDKKGVSELDAQLPQFAGRIQRDKWVQQSKTLHRKKYGEAVK